MQEDKTNYFAKFLDGEIDMDALQKMLGNRNDLDQCLFGRWLHSNFMSGGGLNIAIETYLILGSDGGFIQSSQSYGGASFTDEFGNWAGVSSFKAEVDPDSRGCWTAKEQVLRLDFDNQTYSSFQYEYNQDSLLLHHPSGNKLYKRV